MNIIGQQKSSFIDYPNKICTVYFVGGCNFRCPYCHNKDVVNNNGNKLMEEDILAFLKKRKVFIDAVCISGGEPTLQGDLFEFICELKREGFNVKLDTNGYKPDVLKNLIEARLLDYIAMDIKGPLGKYDQIAGVKIDISLIKESIDLIKNSSIDYEFRTTVCKEFFKKEDIIEVAKMLKGSKRYYLQNFRDGKTVLCGENQLTPFDIKELEEVRGLVNEYFTAFDIRK